MNYLPSDKQFLLLWFKNFIEIEAKVNEEDAGHEQEVNLRKLPMEVSQSVHFTQMDDIHDMGVVTDPRFEGTTCDLSDSLGLRTQIVNNNLEDFESFRRSNRTFKHDRAESNAAGNSKRSVSPMIKSVFSSEREINNLKFEDIQDFNFLQNLLQLIDENEFIIDDNMSNENLINHITYMLKQYLRKRNFDPTLLVDGLRDQLLQEERFKGDIKSEVINNTNITLHNRFDNNGSRSPDRHTGSSFRKIQAKYMFEEPKWFLIKMIFLVAFLNKDKKNLRENGEFSPYQASKIFNEGFDFSSQETIKPNFVISTIFILNEVLSKILCYDDHCAYDTRIGGKRGSFYKSNSKEIQDKITKQETCQPLALIDFHCTKKDNNLCQRVSHIETSQAEDIGIQERISILEKFKSESPPSHLNIKKTLYPTPDLLDSQESEEEEEEYRPFNIMRNSRAERMERFGNKAMTPRAPDSHHPENKLSQERRDKSSAAKLRSFQRKNSLRRAATCNQNSTDDSTKGLNISFKNELYKAKQENKALSEALEKLESRLADETEKSEDKVKNLHKRIKILEKDLKTVTENLEIASDLNQDLASNLKNVLKQLEKAQHRISKDLEIINRNEEKLKELNSRHLEDLSQLCKYSDEIKIHKKALLLKNIYSNYSCSRTDANPFVPESSCSVPPPESLPDVNLKPGPMIPTLNLENLNRNSVGPNGRVQEDERISPTLININNSEPPNSQIVRGICTETKATQTASKTTSDCPSCEANKKILSDINSDCLKQRYKRLKERYEHLKEKFERQVLISKGCTCTKQVIKSQIIACSKSKQEI
ncbi:unnamed protein product [Moneuplotes crassus]|uniref:Uncharacterized protein n=1 Tax=Euplotes crassus TaxID=5936 RepID=A0AAD1Y4L1_EUPCR|nr:unnamed protein product [Moneuplotes crassus]